MRWSRSQLAYCSNVHSGETLEEIQHTISQRVSAVREQRNLASMHAGLWISHHACSHLSSGHSALESFKNLLNETGIELVTLNGFPYGNFHATEVKADVYKPDWSTPERLEYTLDLARILAYCLPESETEGTISTLPLGFSDTWSEPRQHQALKQLCKLAESLESIQHDTGKKIRICLEMEPGCVLERTAQAIALFGEELPEAARRNNLPDTLITSHLGLCYDVCHQAVMFEPARQSLNSILDAGIPVGKIQFSNALDIPDFSDPAVRSVLQSYVEPRYLHQVNAKNQDGKQSFNLDLGKALADSTMWQYPHWRIHFHVPLQTNSSCEQGVFTTQPELGQVLDTLASRPEFHPHIEVETYTWDVLPEGQRPSNEHALVKGLCDELNWLEAQMQERDLLEL